MNNFNPIKYLSLSNWRDIKPGLSRISTLLNHLGNPQNKLKFIHVAGTNGKGSTCAYISQILIESGYKTGLFTSPYIYEFCERIQINNQNINLNDLKNLALQVKKIAETYLCEDPPTEFELITAIGFKYFYENNCDFVICEVGMGGRLDSTNIISAQNTLVSCITSISLDHVEFLGDNIQLIAKEKAGIIKNNTQVISSSQDKLALDIIKKQCSALKSPLLIVNNSDVVIKNVKLDNKILTMSFSYRDFEVLKTNLIANYQAYNASLALEVCLFLSKNYKKITKNSISKGISNCKWPGRFEVKQDNPYVVIDGSHNEEGIFSLIESLQDIFKKDKFVFIFGVLKDKNWRIMAEQISKVAKKIYIIEPPNLRKLDSYELKDFFDVKNVENKIVDIKNAIKIAVSESSTDEIICACGSLYSISCL